MSKRAPMTIVVLSGPDAGRVLRTARADIAVGSGEDNDLVVRDPDVAAHHFVIHVDGSGWRAEPASPAVQIVMDNRWSHPHTGRRGALVYATGTELLLYPGDLEPAVIDAELRQRATSELPVQSSDEPDATVQVAPVSRRGASLPQSAVADELPTVSMGESSPLSGRRTPGIEALALSSMPTIGDAPLPSILAGRRGPDGPTEEGIDPLMPRVVPTESRPRSSAWDRASRARPAAPEILAEPESKMQAMPGSTKSVVARSDDQDAWGSKAKPMVVVAEPDDAGPARPARPEERASGTAWDARASRAPAARPSEPARARASDDAPREVDARPSGSAWDARGSGARDGRSSGAADARGGGAPGRSSGGNSWDTPARSSGGNAWGDRASEPARALEAPRSSGGAWDARPSTGGRKPAPPAPASPGGAWGARPESALVPSAGPSARPPASAPRPAAPYSGRQIPLADLVRRAEEPSLRMLVEPDGELATVMRLFATRLLELQRSYGYRAFMLTSAEPLTGKTTVAMSLAFALAEDAERRVALVEANFRQPRLGEILGLAPDVGLLSVLEGRSAIVPASAKIADRNLLVFPSGGAHPSPAEALASPRFKTLVQELASSVDIAIVDAPAVKTAADANLLMPLVDGALFVVLDEETRGAWLQQAMEQLGAERVLGAVYNHIDGPALKALRPERKARIAALKTRA